MFSKTLKRDLHSFNARVKEGPSLLLQCPDTTSSAVACGEEVSERANDWFSDEEHTDQDALVHAHKVLTSARRMHKAQSYFDCLQEIERALAIVKFPELTSALEAT